jgi:large subunit ribosomal protein L30
LRSNVAKAKGDKQLRVTLLKSRFGRTPGHAQCAAGLGLRRRHQTVTVADTPENRGMIAAIGYMVRVEEA